ncbi:MAG: DoxX family membrane protein [Bacteroidales bacterium]
MTTKQNSNRLTDPQQWSFIILRIIIGWHLLYEGIVKLLDPNWSAESFLTGSQGFFSGAFQWMASQPAVLEMVNILNIWGLILIGLGLFLGFFARTAVYAGILLLFFYYIAYPPFQGYNFGVPQEGNYLLVNKNFIELMSLVVLALFPKTLNIGVWSLLKRMQSRVSLPNSARRKQPAQVTAGTEGSKSRRDMLKHLVFLPFLGGFAWAFMSNKEYGKTDAISGGTITLNQQSLNELEGNIPQGSLGGDKKVSRLIMGCNLIGGWAHARDLQYASQLFKAYNTEKKVFETLMLAEKAGINTMNVCTLEQQSLINRYKKLFGSNLQTMIQAKPTREDLYGNIDRAIDMGVDIIQIFGATGDRWAQSGDTDLLQKCVDHTKRQGYPAGMGAHDIHAFYACDQAGIEVDFYFKTMHHDRYWSATPKEERVPFAVTGSSPDQKEALHDNMWCLFPEETVNYVEESKKPVVGYKVLAGGAIHPENGFQYAFDNGADFICVGMFDFQVVEDANLAIRAIKKAGNRKRPWYG